jgi:single-strand DNA-binding protein
MAYQNVTVLGNLGQDPEVKQLPSGTSVVNCNLAVNETWSDRQTNERKEKTTWFRLAIYGRQAEVFAQYMKKGSQVLVVGTVEARAFMGQDGEPRASLELRVREFRFVGGGGGNGGSGGSGGYDDYAPPPQELDDIPF